MTYSAVDTSTQGGRPVELVRFTMGTTSWRFTSGRTAQTYLGDVYAPETIDRGQVEASQEFGRSELRLVVPYTNAIAQQFANGYPPKPITVSLFRAHLGDGEFITYWRGRIVAATFRGAECELRCEPVFTTLQRIGLRAIYQLQCRHVLYGSRCGVNRSSYAIAGTVATVVDNQVFVAAAAAQPANWLAGGYLEHANGSRMIITHTADSLTLNAPIPGLVAGNPVTLYPGCDRTLSTCGSKFANDVNFGGFPWIPTKNPFSGDALV